MLEIVGAGRVGSAIHRRMVAAGMPGRLLARQDGGRSIAADGSGPILVATRNDDLRAVLAAVPAARHRDLVFVQNGMIRPLLGEFGLEGATRGLLFFAVPRRGDDLAPGGNSPFCGPHAAALVAMFTGLEIPAEVLQPAVFAAVELEKLVWNSAFGLLCQALETDVGGVLADPRCDALLRELIACGAPALELDADAAAMVQRLRAYSASIPDYRGAVKEWPWRNAFFVDAAAAAGTSLPVHEELCCAIFTSPSGPASAG